MNPLLFILCSLALVGGGCVEPKPTIILGPPTTGTAPISRTEPDVEPTLDPETQAIFDEMHASLGKVGESIDAYDQLNQALAGLNDEMGKLVDGLEELNEVWGGATDTSLLVSERAEATCICPDNSVTTTPKTRSQGGCCQSLEDLLK